MMKRGFYIISLKSILFLILICLFTFIGKAQDVNQFNPFSDDISQKLLPLNDLIDSALLHDPNLRFRDLQIVINDCKLKAQQSYWLRNIGVQGDVRYGTFNNFSTNTSEGQNPDIFSSQTSQMVYGIGAYIKLPLVDITNRKSQIYLAKTEIEQAQSMVELQKNEIRKLVITQYNELILKQNLLKISSKYLETCRINMEMAEKEFNNGVIPIGEYSRISQISSTSEAEFERARIGFITSYMLLEEIVGFKFSLTNN